MRLVTTAMLIVAGILCASPTPFAAEQTAGQKAAGGQTKGTAVLGVQLTTATRTDVRAALKSANVPATREADTYWYDLYDASSLLQGADELAVGYSLKSGQLGALQYHFPAQMDPQKVVQIAQMVAEKYGRPNRSSGNVDLGEVKYIWNLPDGVVLTVSRGWPDTSVFMIYEVPPVARKIDAEVAENKKIEQQNTAKRQSNNF